ncbi:MAG: hypothetical protein VKI81_12710, partial [Synechococcaceae cyanobacterium]|nr:hypothetical protein [Synechococcaceae cyanobacterium]
AVSTALAKVPADRFSTAWEFAQALSRPGAGRGGGARRWVRRWWRASFAAAAAVAIGLLLVWIIDPPPALDAGEIVVFPFAVTGAAPADSQLGQSVALAVSWALNTTTSLRALDGWQLLDEGRRASRAGVDLELAREIARSRGAGRLVTGSVLAGDSVRVMLDLYDVRRGTHLQRMLAADKLGDPWVLGLQSAGELIRNVTGGDAALDRTVLAGHGPAALEQFFEGEQDYRRAQFEEAFEHYREAVRAESGFAIAALRAAQAARWSHRDQLDASIVATLAGADSLPPRHAAFARGLQAYADGQADSAVAAFEEALAIDPDWHEAWMALGEVYTHLLPVGPPPDSMAVVAFTNVRRLDRGFTPVLYHLIQIALRDGEPARAAALLDELRRAEPDTLVLEPTALLVRCAADGPDGIDWRATVGRRAGTVSEAGQWFTAGGLPFPACADAAWRALLAHDTTRTYTFGALLGLQAVLMARGRYDEMLALHDADTLFDPAQLGDLEILAVTAGAPFTDRARMWADTLRRLAAADSTFNVVRLWFLGIWEVFDGRPDGAQRIVDRLLAPAALRDGHPEEVRLRRLLAGSLRARIALARGDSAHALDLLTALRPTGGSAALRWYPWESLGLERMSQAELLLARG